MILAGLLAALLPAFAQAPPPAAQSLIARGRQALEAGDFAQAVRSFEQARALAPGDRDVFRGLVLSYLQGGALGEAIAAGREAVGRWPRDPEDRKSVV